MNNKYFERTISLLGEESFNKLSNLKVLIVGLGGVGGSACEQVVRLGIKEIGIVDNDIVDISNINRQVIATITSVSKNKVDVMEKRIKDINDQVIIHKHNLFLEKDNLNRIFEVKYDYVIDCIDSLTSKIDLYKYCLENSIKIISSMGTANKLDPSKLYITTLDKTINDKFAKKIREEVRKNNLDMKKINVVTSLENSLGVIKPLPSYSLVPNTTGIYCVYFIVKDLLDL